MDQVVAQPAAILTATAISGHFPGLLGEIAIAQTFHNPEAIPIEAVFTFPVPVGAVLLDLVVEIDDRCWQGQVLPAARAEADYEDAIIDGDGAILLQAAGRGLYTLNVGNLLPGQEARLRYRYALLGDWEGDSLRLHLPTTLAPRYGDPLQAGLAPHQVPETDMFGERYFILDLALSGGLGQAQISSPSHRLAISTSVAGQRIRLAEGAAQMDRDLILVIRAPAAVRAGMGLSALDRKGGVALVSIQPPFASPPTGTSRDLVLVADASGSMAGDSIAQTRAALAGILDQLAPDDRFNLIVFGSRPEALFPRLQPAGATALALAHARLATLEANLGGTELGAALRLAYGQYQERPLDILLITDGEVWDVEALISAARQSGHRLFTVGVGAAVAAGLVQGLATATGGACALVHPQEDMATQILRHFARLQALGVAVAVAWPAPPLWQWPDPIAGIFAGDSLHLLAGFAQPVVGVVTLTYTLTTGETQIQRVPLTPWREAAGAGILPRLAASRRLAELDAAAASDLAVAYQLVSPHTHYLLVAQRSAADQAETLPALRPIAHTLAAGWGGIGQVGVPASPVAAPMWADAAAVARAGGGDGSFYGISQPMTPYHSGPEPLPPDPFSTFAHWLMAQTECLADARAALPSLDELAAAGLPATLVADLRALVASGTDEEQVVLAILHACLTLLPGLILPRAARRHLRQRAQRDLPPALVAAVHERVAAWTQGNQGHGEELKR